MTAVNINTGINKKMTAVNINTGINKKWQSRQH